MSFTSETIITPNPKLPAGISDTELPSKVFIGYDPKGTHTVTGSLNEHPGQPNVKQVDKSEDTQNPSPEESVTLSPKVSAIARKEQALRTTEAQLKQREKDLADKLAKAEKFDALQAKIAAKDYSAAEELGLKYDEYTDHLVKRQAEKNPQEERLSKAEQELAELKKSQEEQVLKDYQNNQTLWKQEIQRVVDGNDEYSSIKELKAYDSVLEHINSSFEEDGIELTAEQAAKEIEDELVARAEKLSALTKIQKRSATPRQLGAPKTITQNMTVSSQKPVKKPFHLMSESEQIAEAFRRVQEAKQQR